MTVSQASQPTASSGSHPLLPFKAFAPPTILSKLYHWDSTHFSVNTTKHFFKSHIPLFIAISLLVSTVVLLLKMHTSNHLLALLQTLSPASLSSIQKNDSYRITCSLLIVKSNGYDSLAFLFLFSLFEYKAPPSIQSFKPESSAAISHNYLHLILPWLSCLNLSHQQAQPFYLYTSNPFTFLLLHDSQPGTSQITSLRSLPISSSFLSAAKVFFPNCKLYFKWSLNSVSWPMRPIWWDF